MNLAPLENLRGDYAGMAPDWTVPQHLDRYSDEDQAVWRLLVERQSALAKEHACEEFVQGLRTLGIGDGIPDFETVNARLEPLTGWRIVGVPGLIPDAAFYDHLAHRRFPVTVWIRGRAELDYLVEPDLFHDFFGHVPLLSNPVFADYIQLYGQRALEAGSKIDLLARLYWYTVEFGLIRDAASPNGVKIYGAGIVSSKGETLYSQQSVAPNRLGFDLERVMRTRYRIDTFQKTYFVIDDFAQLFGVAQTDFAPLLARLAAEPPFMAGDVLDDDRVITRGSQEGWQADGDI
jgi:phenylalanine-4-hydroxylase